MSMTIDEFEKLIKLEEDEHLEFKVAKDGFDNDQLLKYCCAFANEKGGKFVLGVTDKDGLAQLSQIGS